MNISACGLICNDCQFHNNQCAGCYEVKGKTFWAKEVIPGGICPLFDCSINNKNYKSCGDCNELPCQRFMDLKDPNISEDEHMEMIKKRIEVLKK